MRFCPGKNVKTQNTVMHCELGGMFHHCNSHNVIATLTIGRGMYGSLCFCV